MYVNIFRLSCVKLRIRMGNFKGVFIRVLVNIAMTSDRLSFSSVEDDKSYSLTLPPWKICVTGGHVTSCNHGLSFNDKDANVQRCKGRERRESLGTRVELFTTPSKMADELTSNAIGKSFPHFGTLAIHAGQDPEQWNSRAVVPPIFMSSTYQQDAPGVHRVTTNYIIPCCILGRSHLI